MPQICPDIHACKNFVLNYNVEEADEGGINLINNECVYISVYISATFYQNLFPIFRYFVLIRVRNIRYHGDSYEIIEHWEVGRGIRDKINEAISEGTKTVFELPGWSQA